MERGKVSEAAVSLALSKPAMPLGNQSEGGSGKWHLHLLCFKILLPLEKFGMTRPAGFQITYPEVTYSQEHCRTSTSLLSPPQATCSAECTQKPAHVEQKEPESQVTGGNGSSATVLGYTCIHGCCRTSVFVLCHISKLLERLPLLYPQLLPTPCNTSSREEEPGDVPAALPAPSEAHVRAAGQPAAVEADKQPKGKRVEQPALLCHASEARQGEQV